LEIWNSLQIMEGIGTVFNNNNKSLVNPVAKSNYLPQTAHSWWQRRKKLLTEAAQVILDIPVFGATVLLLCSWRSVFVGRRVLRVRTFLKI